MASEVGHEVAQIENAVRVTDGIEVPFILGRHLASADEFLRVEMKTPCEVADARPGEEKTSVCVPCRVMNSPSNDA
jgi:hypothetical protein